MTLKTKMSLLVFLTTVSIVSVGFSSWSITAETQAEIGGRIEVDNVISSDKYIKLDKTKGENNTGIECFKYKENGYLDDDGLTVTDTGYIYAYLTMDLEKCNELFIGGYDSIKLDVTLKYTDDTKTNLNLFKRMSTSEGYQDIKAYCITEDPNINSNIRNTQSSVSVEYLSTITFNNVLSYYTEYKDTNSKLNFYIKYELFATTDDYFYNNIFKYLYSDMIDVIDFELEIKVTAI